MIQYIINREKRTIEFLSGGSFEELQDLINQFEGYSFIVSLPPQQKDGMVVGANYVSIIGNTRV